MRKKEPPSAKRTQDGSVESIQRLELLSWRFSQVEIDRLSQLQLQHRGHLDTLDLPIEEGRLQFARWLVERGRLSEDDGSGLWEPSWRQEPSTEKWPQPARTTASPAGASSEEPDREPAHESESVDNQQCKDRRLSFVGVWMGMRKGLAGVAGIGRAVGSWLCQSGEAVPWVPFDPYGLYGPYGPYGSPQSSAEAQWYWIYLRRPW
jgi:hypothetical protein